MLAVRGKLFWFHGNPEDLGEKSYHFIEDGVILLKNGKVFATGTGELLSQATTIVDHRPHLIMPGFIDVHVHMPQTQVIASYGTKLLEWLNKYTFPEEARYYDAAIARANANFLLDNLLAHGTTTCVAFGSVHPQSVDAFFEASLKRNMFNVAGKVMMDRNAPENLRDTPQSSYDETKALIAKWQGRGRVEYAISPRFAITSSPEQLEAAGVLAKEHPECYIQTHLSETVAEIDYTLSLYPQFKHYTAIYEHFGLVRANSLFGHCIHLSADERGILAQNKAVAVFCPTSNLFLGSGLFDWQATRLAGVRIGLATDIGGGTSYSMLQTMSEAYKVLQLQGQSLHPLTAFHAATRGNALALGKTDLGHFEKGATADFIVLNPKATKEMAHRYERVNSIEETLFLLMMMGDDRAVAATYLAGEAKKCADSLAKLVIS